ncbi:MAG: S-layer homology domain-containing protein [Oscillospiraceae bacterium]
MKSLNRTLSLVLVLAMCLGLFGIASAATFTDDSTIQYSEAVSVMNGIGAINGYTDGTFKPTGTITREEAAKMVTYAVLGPTVAAKLSVSSTGFTDVASSRWSAPYIAYCVSQGIINGLGDGTFAPTANVTGYQLAKMMLAAAGYGKAGEFTGASWELNAAVMANKFKVFSSSKAPDFSKSASREEAALYVFNALTKVPQVTYSKTNETYTKVTAGTHDVNSDTFAQIIDDVYTTLVTVPATVGGSTGYFWKQGNTNISNFVTSDATLATSTDGTSFANLTTNSSAYYINYQADTSPAVTYYYNDGAASASYPSFVASDDTLAENEAAIKALCATPGATVKFLDTDSDGQYDKVSVTVKTAEKLAAAPTTTTSGAVTTVNVGTISKTSDMISYPSGLVKGDVILYYTSVTGKVYVEKAAAVTGIISSYVNGSYVSINGTKYYPSGLYITGGSSANVTSAALQALIGKAGYTFYLDNGGNIVFVVAPTGVATVSNTFFVSAAQKTTTFGVDTYQAAIAKMDGTQDVITVSKTASYGGTLTTVASATAGLTTSGNLGAGLFYTYAQNSDGTYSLTAAQNQSANVTDITKGASNVALDSGDTSFVVTGNKAQFLGSATSVGATWTGATTVYTSSKIATSSTVFMYYNSTTKTYTVKTGVVNALSYAAGGTVYVLTDSTDTYAQVVICTGASSTTSASGYDQIFVTSGETVAQDANGATLYSYTAIVNGVKDKAVTSYQSLSKGVLYFAKDYATNGAFNTAALITDISAGAKHISLVDVSYSNSVLTVDGGTDASYILSGNVAIYLCNVTASGTSVSQITAETADALTYDTTNDTIYLIPTSASDATIAAIYIFVD